MRLLQGMLLMLALTTILPAHSQDQGRRSYRPIDSLKIKSGQEVPDFAVNGITLSAYRGKPLLINFYTVNCGPCIKEIPKLNALKHLNPDLQVLAITPDSPAEALDYANMRGLAWPIAAPGQDYLFDTLGVPAFPTFAIIDERGKLVSATYGNQLGGEDGHATLSGISDWVESVLGTRLR